MSNTIQAFNVTAMQGAFASGLDTAPESWAVKVSPVIYDPSNVVDLVDYASVQAGRKTVGSRHIQRAGAKQLLAVNERITNAVTIPINKWSSDRVGMWSRMVEELAHESVLNWDNQAVEVIKANSNKTLRGVTLFNTDNTVTGATLSTLTVEQAATAINKLVAKMKSRNEGDAAPRNANMRELMLLTGNGELAGTLSAAVAQQYLAGGQTNPVNGWGLTISVVSEPRLTGNAVYGLRSDGSGPRPIFNCEQLFIEEWADENSDHFRTFAEYFYGYQTFRCTIGGDDFAAGRINFA